MQILLKTLLILTMQFLIDLTVSGKLKLLDESFDFLCCYGNLVHLSQTFINALYLFLQNPPLGVASGFRIFGKSCLIEDLLLCRGTAHLPIHADALVDSPPSQQLQLVAVERRCLKVPAQQFLEPFLVFLGQIVAVPIDLP
jgi:hypothetical protein